MFFCTLFDSNYASKGIALYLSIQRYTSDFVLYVMGLDRECQEILTACGFKNLVVECLDDIMSPELEEAKGNRSRAEFCWTCGPYITDYFLNKYDLPEIAYLDSDLMFFCSPKVIIDELEEKKASIGIVPHFTKYPLFGTYCVQFVYFKNDNCGRECLTWWRNQCLKWCYCKMEDGKYADQKYLDYFEELFDNVGVIENRGVGVAFWNMDYYTIANGAIKYKKECWPMVFFHYSGFSTSVKNGEMIMQHTMYVTKSISKWIVEPYASLLKEVYSDYMHIPVSSVIIRPVSYFKDSIKRVVRFLNRVLPIDYLIAVFMKMKYREKRVPYNEPK